jgi:hypothetical protein
MKLAQAARQSLAYDRAKLSVVPVASRFGSLTEFRESREWIERTAEAMADFYSDWTPSWVAPIQVVEKLKLPQVDYFGFGEKLAVVEHGVDDPGGLGFVYDCLANLLGNDLRNAENILSLRPNADLENRRQAVGESDHFDFYVSYDHTSRTEEFLRDFIELLREQMEERMGRRVSCFFDYRELSGEDIRATQLQALKSSQLMLVFLTRRSASNGRWQWEVRDFERKAGATNLIFPVLLEAAARGAESFPGMRRGFDCSEFFEGDFRAAKRRPSSRMLDGLASLAEQMVDALRKPLKSGPRKAPATR